MAQEYGGRFSPGGASAQESLSKRPAAMAPGMFRARLLFLAPLPLLFRGFGQLRAGDSLGLILDAAAFAVIWIGVGFLIEGLKAEAEFNARASARKPAFPRKVFAAALIALSTGFAAATSGGLTFAAGVAIATAALFIGAFGLDPLKDKGMTGIDRYAADRANRAIAEAETYVADMIAAIGKLNDRKLARLVTGFTDSARAMFRDVEADPRDLSSARKYLTVYLMGARDATTKFVELYARSPEPDTLENYQALLTDLERNFEARRQEMLLDDQGDLDIEIEVLRDRLNLEGVSLDQEKGET